MNKKEITMAFRNVLFCVVLGGVILLLGKTRNSVTEEPLSVFNDKFSESREIVWVKSDSLLKLLDEIKTKQPGVFEIEDSDSKIVFRALDEKPFNAIFLDGEYISRFNEKQGLGIKKIDNSYGFSVDVEEKKDIPFAKMPAEVMQSILINKP